MSKFLLTVCVFGLLLSSASAQEDELKEGIVLVRIVKPLSGSMLPIRPTAACSAKWGMFP
jgi:hypothetical protein